MRNKIITTIIGAFMTIAAHSQVIVNEFCASNDTIEIGGQYSDWIEIYNNGDKAENLKGYQISDNPKNPSKYIIDCDVIIYPGTCKLILCNGIGKGVNASFRLSNNDGEYVIWSDPQGNIIDKIEIPNLRRDQSWGRTVDGGDVWAAYSKATPGSLNMKSTPLSPKPTFSQNAGFYTSAPTITISCSDPSATIYYTTDGSKPTPKSTKYSKPIKISQTQVLRAVAECQGMSLSEPTTATYFVNLRKVNIPIVSLSTDSKWFYDDYTGIYVEGKNGISGNCSDTPKNWNQDWERPVYIEYFDYDKKLQISQDAGIKITGSCSRGNDMKSLRVIARKEYGDNRLRYKFFATKDITEFKQIVLRNGGNDFAGTMLRDAVSTGIAAQEMDIDVQAFQSAAVFLNGEYLGLHNIREKVSNHFLEENYGVDSDEVDLLENENSINDGDNADYIAMIDFIKKNSLQDQANYNKICNLMDIDNFIDYWIVQIYIDNEDWPANNIRFWRSHGTNSKWRWILFGSEFACGIYGGKPDVNSLFRDVDINSTGWQTRDWSTLLIRKLLENNDFRNKFITRYSYHIEHTFRYERIKEFTDSLKNIMDNEWYYHGEKWFRWWHEHDAWVNSVNSMLDWYYKRPPYAKEHLRSYFGLGDEIDLTVEADCNNAKYSLNGDILRNNIDGKFFAGTEIKLNAKLPDDREIDYWEIEGKECHTFNVFSYGDKWKYQDKGYKPSNDWQSNSYVSQNWSEGNAPLGYDNSNRATTKLSYGSDCNNKYPTYYFHKTVNISNISTVVSASITLKVDDGCVVYVNGKEQGRVQYNGNGDYDTWSTTYYADVADLPENTIVINTDDLVEGNNLIAIEVHQCGGYSSDLWLDAKMSITTSSNDVTKQQIYNKTAQFALSSNTKITLHTKQANNTTCNDRTQTAKGIVINEIATRNFGTVADENNQYPAWIEFYNTTNNPINMAGLYVMNKTQEYQIPCTDESITTIPAKGYLVFFLDGHTDLGPQHLGLTINPDEKEGIYLGEIIAGISEYLDWFDIPELKKGYSYGRKTDGNQDLVTFCKPTPYSSNSQGEIVADIPIYTPVKETIAPEKIAITAFPNPTNDYVEISGIQNPNYEVLNTNGQKLFQGKDNKIDLTGLPQGIYIIKIKDSEMLQCVKIMKK